MISSSERIERGSWPGSAHEARRFILDRLPGSSAVEGLSAEADRYGRVEEPAVLIAPTIIEDGPFRAIRVVDADTPRGVTGFNGFLDGTQKIEVLAHDNGIPILWATVSAAVRSRVNRRMVAWPARTPVVRSAYYVPLKYVKNLHDEIRKHPTTVDTSAASSAEKVPSRHPAALREAAIRKIQFSRERAELELVEAWCDLEPGVLYVDGSLTGSPIASTSNRAVGVVKSHNRIYADGDALDVLIGLNAGERTSVFRPPVETNRFPVASWYVRVRQGAGHDALFGLVRVEASLSSDVAARADEISRWIIAEGSPLALPDGRWDKMAYGIRDTEEFLRAIS